MSESALQSSIVQFLRLSLPAGYKVLSIPNGGKRDRITGAILKREGAISGAPDLEIIGPGGSVAFIELKTATGRLSASQKAFGDWCGEWSVPFAVCRSLGDVQAFLDDLNIPLKASLAA